MQRTRGGRRGHREGAEDAKGAACAACAEGAGGSEASGHVGARAAKAVDGLVVVAHRGKRDHAARRQQLQQLCRCGGAEAQRCGGTGMRGGA